MSAGLELGLGRGRRRRRGERKVLRQNKEHLALAQQLSDSEEQSVSQVRRRWRSMCVLGGGGGGIPTQDRVCYEESMVFRPGTLGTVGGESRQVLAMGNVVLRVLFLTQDRKQEEQDMGT